MASTEQELNIAKDLLEKQEAINAAKQKQRELDADILGLSSSLVDSIKEIQGISTKRSTFDQNLLKVNKKIAHEISGQRSGLSDISSIQKQISKNQDLIEKSKRVENALESGIFGQEKKRLELANDKATSIAEQRTIQEGLLANAEKSGKLDKAAYNLSVQKLTKDEASLTAITSKLAPMSKQALFTKQNNIELERQNKLREKEKEIIEKNEKKLGAFGGILKGISKIPILGDLVDTNEILGSAMDTIKKGGDGVAGLSAGLGEAGSQMVNGLTKPANIALFAFTAMLGVIKTMGELILGNNEKITKFEKTMVMSKDEAKNLAGTFAETAEELDDINVTSKASIHTFMDMSEQFGFMAKFSQDTLSTATRLQATTGITAEAAGVLAASSELTAGSFDDQYKNAIATSYELQRQTGVQFDIKGILEETSKVTGTVRANLGGNIEEIAKAVTQAKLFGASLEDVASAGNALLDFESSITKELEAELLIGRDINLEKARAAALAGDQVALAQELQKEAGTLSEFQDMNVIQQQALAAAMGMTSDQMADILFQQEIQGKTAGDLRALGKDELANRLEQQTAQQALNASMENAKSALGDMLKFIDPLLQGVAGFAATLAGIKPVLVAIGALLAGLAVRSMALAIINFAMAIPKIFGGMAPFGPAGIAMAIGGVAAMAAAVAGASSVMGTADDMVSPGGNGGGYGNRTLMGPEGAIALNNKDTVIAGTNLFPKGDDVVSRPAGAIQMPDNSEAKKTNALLEALINKPAPTVQMDSIEVGTVAGMSAFSIQ
jgi:hypothetical protein|tara:strand:- start:7340 stop:9691 length:2352 start_codon:yes stop_codon:yes gene_type:complete